jgi:putative FmdB family regulatory protein
MPIYEYECGKCGHKFDRIEPFDSQSRRKCPVCGGKAERVFPSGVGFVFKGSGFYATDYAKKDKPRKEGTGDKTGGESKESE